MENYKTKKLNDSTIEVTITLSKESVSKSYETILNSQLTGVNVKGFRKGKSPRELVEPQLRAQILFDVLNRLVPLHLQNVVEKEKIELIATPEIQGTPELTTDEDSTVTIHCTVMPEFKLGNMKKVKVEIGKEGVKDEEVESIMKQLEGHKAVTAKKGTKKWLEEAAKALSLETPKSEEDLKTEIKNTLQKEKEAILLRKAENDALNQAIKLSNIEIPDPAMHYEAHERQHSFEHQVQQMGMTLEQYAAQMKTTVENLSEAFHKDAKEALETDVFLKLYAKTKKISLTEKELEEETEKVKKSNNQNPDLYDTPEWKKYIENVALKQRAYEAFLKEVLPKKK